MSLLPTVIFPLATPLYLLLIPSMFLSPLPPYSLFFLLFIPVTNVFSPFPANNPLFLIISASLPIISYHHVSFSIQIYVHSYHFPTVMSPFPLSSPFALPISSCIHGTKSFSFCPIINSHFLLRFPSIPIFFLTVISPIPYPHPLLFLFRLFSSLYSPRTLSLL